MITNEMVFSADIVFFGESLPEAFYSQINEDKEKVKF